MFKARYEKLKIYEYSTFWKMVHQAGSLPGQMAQRIGFVDFLPPLNPLDDLLSYRRAVNDSSNSSIALGDDDEKQKNSSENKVLEAKWAPLEGSPNTFAGPLTSLEQFPASKQISIMEYARKTKEQESQKEQQWQVYERVQMLPAGIRSLLGMMGFYGDKVCSMLRPCWWRGSFLVWYYNLTCSFLLNMEVWVWRDRGQGKNGTDCCIED